jgi:hypothetical protein
MKEGWLCIAWLLAIVHFFAPLLILLFRNAKEAPALLGWLAGALLAAHQLDIWWTVFPSLPVGWWHWLWTVPLTCAAFVAAAYAAMSKRTRFAAASTAGGSHG